MAPTNEKPTLFSIALVGVWCFSAGFFGPMTVAADFSAPKPQSQSVDSFEEASITDESSLQIQKAKKISASAINPVEDVLDLTTKTDLQINDLVRNWPQLDPAKRRDLLAEARSRMNRARVESAQTNAALSDKGRAGIEQSLVNVQRHYRYGQSIRRDKNATVVIAAKVTRVLPDGTRVTQRMITPVPLKELRQKSAQGEVVKISLPEIPSAVLAPTLTGDSGISGTLTSSKAAGRVVRTRVRFGAGFGRRTQNGVNKNLSSNAPALPAESSVNARQMPNITEVEDRLAVDQIHEKVSSKDVE
jgi:hypothetical protein